MPEHSFDPLAALNCSILVMLFGDEVESFRHRLRDIDATSTFHLPSISSVAHSTLGSSSITRPSLTPATFETGSGCNCR